MRMYVVGLVLLALCASGALASTTFDGEGDWQLSTYGYYYAITGGKFPTGTTPNGDNASGGTFRFVTDDPAWGYAIDTWIKDDWFPQNASLALTLKNGDSIVYDNNGIEDGSYGNYYNATDQGVASTKCPGLYRGYSMSNNFDWIYAGYFKLEEATTFTSMLGYFDAVPDFDPTSPCVSYGFNIWSNVEGNLLPVNTGSFSGDVLNSDRLGGTFTTSDSGVDRVFGTDYGSKTDDILRLTYTLDAPVTLGPGTYWFSHDARLAPEPASLVLIGVAAGAGAAFRRRRKR